MGVTRQKVVPAAAARQGSSGKSPGRQNIHIQCFWAARNTPKSTKNPGFRPTEKRQKLSFWFPDQTSKPESAQAWPKTPPYLIRGSGERNPGGNAVDMDIAASQGHASTTTRKGNNSHTIAVRMGGTDRMRSSWVRRVESIALTAWFAIPRPANATRSYAPISIARCTVRVTVARLCLRGRILGYFCDIPSLSSRRRREALQRLREKAQAQRRLHVESGKHDLERLAEAEHASGLEQYDPLEIFVF